MTQIICDAGNRFQWASSAQIECFHNELNFLAPKKIDINSKLFDAKMEHANGMEWVLADLKQICTIEAKQVLLITDK